MKQSRLPFIAAAIIPLMIVASPANADTSERRFQIKGFLTTVQPDAAITEVNTDMIGLPPGAQTSASDSIILTIAAEYLFSPNISFETVCCWCCQSNANPSPLFAGQQVLHNEKFAPFAKGGVS